MEGSFSEREDGTSVVELTAASAKLRDDGLGRSTDIPIDDWIDVGVFGEASVDG